MSDAKQTPLPAWAREMGEILEAGATSQFILHGSVLDVVPMEKGDADVTVFLTDAKSGVASSCGGPGTGTDL
jgi:hypothetical protein